MRRPSPSRESRTSCRFPRSCRRQTDLLVAAAATGRAVNIKKGQFLAPLDMRHAVAKVTDSGNDRVFVTERGFTFGYNNLVVDMRAFPMMRGLGVPVVFDVTHSLQLPGAGDGVTAGQAEFIEPLASAGVAAGVDGVFLEVHEEPARAKSDAQNALRLDQLAPLLDRLVRIDAIVRATGRDAPRLPRHDQSPREPRQHEPRSRAQGARDRSGGDPRPARSASISASNAPLDARLRLPRPGHRHRHGQVRHHLPQDRRDAHRAPARPRSSCIPPKRSTAISARCRPKTW